MFSGACLAKDFETAGQKKQLWGPERSLLLSGSRAIPYLVLLLRFYSHGGG